MDWLFISPAAQIISDHMGGSGARQKAKMYAKVEKELGEYINKLEALLDTAKELREQQSDTYVNGCGTAEGRILTGFRSAVNTWNGRYNHIMMNMTNGLNMLRLRKVEAAQKKEYYEMQAQMEEMSGNG